MFLDTLSRFIEERREHLDDWLFLLLLRLLHRQGTDMLSSIHYKLMLVLELVRCVCVCVCVCVLKYTLKLGDIIYVSTSVMHNHTQYSVNEM